MSQQVNIRGYRPNQVYLKGLNNRLSGDYYIGKTTVPYEPDHLLRQIPDVPPIFKRPPMKYVRDPDAETVETLSVNSDNPNSKPTSLEYRITGITWHTPRFRNTCTMDNFLSAWVRKIRQTHGSYLKHLKTEDRVGSALYEIADHALCAKESVDAEFVKAIWLMAILPKSDELEAMRTSVTSPIDCTGIECYSVFQHLEYHNSFEIVSKCSCGTFYHRDFLFEVPNVKEIEFLGDPKLLYYAQMPTCSKCTEPRILLELNPDPNNWLLVFHNYGTNDCNSANPLLSEIPQIIQVGNFMYKLEYVSYCQNNPNSPGSYHKVSLQFIRHKWYLYDGALSPKFRYWGGLKYALHSPTLTTLVYFKI
jgi:hypothetical protein